MIIPERLAEYAEMTLLKGKHATITEGMCAMECAAWIAGEEFTDHPQCVCPVIGEFLRSWNDAIADDAERTRIIGPLVPLTIGTRSGKDAEGRRAFACIDWMVRDWIPAWMDGCSDRYATGTAALRSLPAITIWDSLTDFMPILADLKRQASAARDAAWAATRDATRAAAWDATRAAAWDATRAATRDAAWDATWDATRDAAWDAAWAATWDAAWDATRDAAWDATRDATRDAANKKLEPLKIASQASAANLVRRLCAM